MDEKVSTTLTENCEKGILIVMMKYSNLQNIFGELQLDALWCSDILLLYQFNVATLAARYMF